MHGLRQLICLIYGVFLGTVPTAYASGLLRVSLANHEILRTLLHLRIMEVLRVNLFENFDLWSSFVIFYLHHWIPFFLRTHGLVDADSLGDAFF